MDPLNIELFAREILEHITIIKYANKILCNKKIEIKNIQISQ